jgi:hypothetical protein
MAFNKCKKEKGCSCKKKEQPYCGPQEHECHKSELYKWCDTPKDDCHKTTCEEECTVQLDSKEVFYKLKGSCFSELEFIGIPKGSSLEFIIERFAQLIDMFSYIDLRDNKYGAKTIEEYLEKITLEIDGLIQAVYDRDSIIEALDNKIKCIEQRLADLENPRIVDTNAIGFTVNSGLNEVLQKLSDNIN